MAMLDNQRVVVLFLVQHQSQGDATVPQQSEVLLQVFRKANARIQPAGNDQQGSHSPKIPCFITKTPIYIAMFLGV